MSTEAAEDDGFDACWGCQSLVSKEEARFEQHTHTHTHHRETHTGAEVVAAMWTMPLTVTPLWHIKRNYAERTRENTRPTTAKAAATTTKHARDNNFI